jgi:hypothetical protein
VIRRRALAAVLLFAAPAVAKDVTWLPGAGREIRTSLSAWRDAPVLEGAFVPKAQGSVGLELGVVSIRGGSVTWRPGTSFLVALENHQDRQVFPARELWRGLFCLQLAVSFDALGRRLGTGGALELTLSAGHESDHATDGPNPFPPRPGRDIPNGGAGNHLSAQLSARMPIHGFVLVTRLAARGYVDGDFSGGSLADVEIHRPGGVEPFLSVHAEALVASGSWDDARRLRVLAGAAFPGVAGSLAVFASLSAGDGYGLLVNRRETQLSAGVRYSPF